MHPTGVAILFEVETLRVVFLVFGSGVIAALTGGASQRDHDPILFAFTCHVSLRS
jgi:hypothetical protein